MTAEFIAIVTAGLVNAGVLVAFAVVLMHVVRDLRADLNAFRAETGTRFDGIAREFADVRERMARLEGVMDGLVTGRRDRDAA